MHKNPGLDNESTTTRSNQTNLERLPQLKTIEEAEGPSFNIIGPKSQLGRNTKTDAE